MTRAAVYIVSLSIITAVTVMTFVSIYSSRWMTWSSTSPSGQQYHKTLGLHRSCASTTGACHDFPSYADCHGDDRYFCTIWRTSGFLMTFTSITDLVTIFALLIVVLGGRAKRQHGWKIICGLLSLVVLAECLALALVAYLFDYDDRFLVPGWRLDTGFILCAVSCGVAAATILLLSLSAFLMTPEGDYELIPDDIHGG